MTTTIMIVSWTAVFLLSISYWFQIWRIHVHKEVRDLSLTYHFLLALGFGILAVTAFVEGSTIFLIKQVLTTLPVVVIISQILYHRQDTWHDAADASCVSCDKELEPHWTFCAYCGSHREQA